MGGFFGRAHAREMGTLLVTVGHRGFCKHGYELPGRV